MWTIGAETAAGSRAAIGGGPNANVGASSVPIGAVIIHIHSTLEGGIGGSDTILMNR
jgi:hypothetical protein